MSVWLRVAFLALVAANLLVFTFLKVRTASNEAAAMRIEEVQINAGSVKLLGATARGGGLTPAAGAVGGAATAACLEWAPLSKEDVPAADSALERLSLARPAIRRALAESGGPERFAYFLREPDPATVGQIAELQRMFPGTQINAGRCPEDVAAPSGK